MSEATELQPGIDPAPSAPAAPVELRYEYQPTDDQGRPLGGKQVIKYTTPEELASKLVEQNTLLLRELRSEKRKNRLGIAESESIPDTAPRYQEPTAFAPRNLSAEERVKLSRDLLDPEKFDEASDALFEAKVGAKPQVISQTLSRLQAAELRANAKAESDAFVASNPQYVKCKENFEAITNWMLRYDLAPVRENFQQAYDTLKAAGVLIENIEDAAPAPVVEPTPAPIPEPVAEPVAEPAPAVEPTAPPAIEPAPVAEPQKPARIPTGLSRNTSDDTGAPRSVGDDIVYEVVVNGKKRVYTGLQAINAMPSDEYKRRVLSDPSFTRKEAQLEKEAAERRRAR